MARKIKSIPKICNSFPYVDDPTDPFGKRLCEYTRKEGLKTLDRADASLDDIAFSIIHCLCYADYWEATQDLKEQKNYKAKLCKIMGKDYCGEEYLSFEYYACHWLWSVGEMYAKRGKNLRFSEKDILDRIEEKYGIKEVRHPYFPTNVKYVVNI